MEICPRDGYATSFYQMVDQGITDETALNSICLQCSNGGEVCSSKGNEGSWARSPNCNEGYKGSNLQFEDHQLFGGDTAANDLELVCGDGDHHHAGNSGDRGVWLGYQYCPAGEVICGLQTTVKRAQNAGDDTALNGVYLQCCMNVS